MQNYLIFQELKGASIIKGLILSFRVKVISNCSFQRYLNSYKLIGIKSFVLKVFAYLLEQKYLPLKYRVFA